MSNSTPDHYQKTKKRYPELFNALESLGTVIKRSGSVDAKHAQLIQLAAAAAIQSEGAVHSHINRAIESGAQPDEIYHSLILLTSTIGLPRVMAALSWADDVLEKA